MEDKPFATWALSNNSAEIRRVKDRIKSLSQQKKSVLLGWEFDGGKVEANTEANRLQIFFEDKPDEATREALKSNGFRWSPKAGAWQRQLNQNAIRAAARIDFLRPEDGTSPLSAPAVCEKRKQRNVSMMGGVLWTKIKAIRF